MLERIWFIVFVLTLAAGFPCSIILPFDPYCTWWIIVMSSELMLTVLYCILFLLPKKYKYAKRK